MMFVWILVSLLLAPLDFGPALADAAPANAELTPTYFGRWADLEAERKLRPGGNHRLAALDAYLEGSEAWEAGESEAAIEHWERSARFDLDFVPARIRLVQANLFTDVHAAAQKLRECTEIAGRDFTAQRWILRHGILGGALALTLASLSFAVGLLVRHARALHHTVMETLSYALRIPRSVAASVAIVVLFMPWLANLGPLATTLFLVFLASYRFRRSERLLALGAATWVFVVGPLLVASAAWWSTQPDGRDASLIAMAEQLPDSPATRSRVQEWLAMTPDGGVPLYLAALSEQANRNMPQAAQLYQRAAATGEIPPWVLETNVGNALVSTDDPEMGTRHYRRAIEMAPAAFEPHYNLALVEARKGRYLQADEQFDRASRIDLDRMRALTRTADRIGPNEPVAAMWPAADLWTWTLRHPGPHLTPTALSWLLPARSPLWSAPIVLIAVLGGLFCGRWMRRLIHVHECYQCGGAVCRRCLVRLDRRAYCPRCAEALGGMSSGEATRMLLRRLLEEKPAWSGQLPRLLAQVLPGIGPLLSGAPGTAVVSGLLAGIGITLLTYGSWGSSLLPGPWNDPIRAAAHTAGLALLAFSIFASLTGVRHARRQAATLRAYFARDVDRLAA